MEKLNNELKESKYLVEGGDKITSIRTGIDSYVTCNLLNDTKDKFALLIPNLGNCEIGDEYVNMKGVKIGKIIYIDNEGIYVIVSQDYISLGDVGKQVTGVLPNGGRVFVHDVEGYISTLDTIKYYVGLYGSGLFEHQKEDEIRMVDPEVVEKGSETGNLYYINSTKFVSTKNKNIEYDYIFPTNIGTPIYTLPNNIFYSGPIFLIGMFLGEKEENGKKSIICAKTGVFDVDNDTYAPVCLLGNIKK